MDETSLKEKLRRIEALFSGAATPGERDAAEAARERILLRLKELQAQDPATEWKFTLNDSWAVKVFSALCRRYGLKPFRYHRQRRTTVMVQVPHSFVETTLWPEFKELSSLLQEYLTEVTDRLISSEIHKDTSEAEEVPEALQLASGPVTGSTPPAARPPGGPAPTSPPRPPTAPSKPAPTVSVARNVPCPCGSRRKYKKCCGKQSP